MLAKRRSSLTPDRDADRTVTFALDGEKYEIDLTEQEYRTLQATIAAALSGPDVRVRRTWQEPADLHTHPARLWAHRHGYHVSQGGPVPQPLLDLWEADGSPTEVPTDRQRQAGERRLATAARSRAVRPGPKRRPDLLHEMQRMYAAGYTLVQLSAKYDVDRRWLRNALADRGVRIRPGGQAGHREAAAIRRAVREAAERKQGRSFSEIVRETERPPLDEPRICESYRTGSSIEDLASTWQVSSKTIRDILKKNHVPTRSRGARGSKERKRAAATTLSTPERAFSASPAPGGSNQAEAVRARLAALLNDIEPPRPTG